MEYFDIQINNQRNKMKRTKNQVQIQTNLRGISAKPCSMEFTQRNTRTTVLLLQIKIEQFNDAVN